MIAIFLGLMAALAWGGGDFAGGLASRRIGAYLAVFYAELVGFVGLMLAVPFIREPLPPTAHLLISAAVGAIGSFALMILYHAMTTGLMSIATPISALLAAALPILIGLFTDGAPGLPQWLGFAFALAAVWLISQNSNDERAHIHQLADLKWPFLAGLGFGLYFVLINRVTQEAVFWPMLASRIGGTVVLTAYILLRRPSLGISKAAWPLVITNAVLDIGGNLLYILAGQSGRMDVAAVIASLYPGGTVILAWIFLKERLSRTQAFGIASALAAIALMTL